MGGKVVDAEIIENYPGFPEGISGTEIVSLIEQQAMKFGLETAIAEDEGLEIRGEEKIVEAILGEWE